MAAKILFSEKQRFKQWWIWLILLAVIFIPIFGLYHEMQKPEPFADPAVNTGLILSLIITIPVTALFLFMKLETQINEDGIAVKFIPLHSKFRQFNWNEIEQISVRKYIPLGEFGGWGLRYGLQGKAYNIAGNQGIQIIFKNGKRLLVGTQKPEEAALALKQAQVPVQ